MPDPENLDRLLRALRSLLVARPSLRIGQALAIAAGPDLSAVADAALVEAVEELAELAHGVIRTPEPRTLS